MSYFLSGFFLDGFVIRDVFLIFRFVLSLLASSPPKETDILTPRSPTPLRAHYDWEEMDIVPQHVSDQLHNTVI